MSNWLDQQRIHDSHRVPVALSDEIEFSESPVKWISHRLYPEELFEDVKDWEEADRPEKWEKKVHGDLNVVMKRYEDQFGRFYEVPVKRFTDTSRILEPGNHVFVVGTTGKGKSVIMLGIDLMLFNQGFSVIHRDDGGLDSLLLAPLPELEDHFHIWVPKGMQFDTLNWQPKNPVCYFDPLNQKKLVSQLLNTHGFHTILFDAFCVFGEATIKFWGPFFRQLIFQVQQIPTHQRTRRVISADELHDIVQPAAHSLTRDHQQARGMMELNIRKIRKFGLKLVASAQRPNSLPLNIRSQFAYFLFKKTYPADAYGLLNQMLAHVPSRLFWLIVNDTVRKLKVDQFYLFDDSGNYDKFTNIDLPRWYELLTPKERKKALKEKTVGLKTDISGSVEKLFGSRDDEIGERFDWKDLEAYRQRAPPRPPRPNGKPMPYHEIGKLLGMGKSTVQDRVAKMNRIDELKEILKELTT